MSGFDDPDFDFDYYDDSDYERALVSQAEAERMVLTSAGLNFVLTLAAAALFIASFCLCRRMGDRARNVVTWMKISLLFFGLSVFVLAIGNVLNYVHLREGFIGFGAITLTIYIGTLFRLVTAALILRLLASLGLGILQARTPSQPPRMATPVRALATLAMALIILLSLVYFALGMASQFGNTRISVVLSGTKLFVAIYALLFVGSVLALGASVFVRAKTVKNHPTLKSSCLVYILCAFLFWVSNLYEIIYCGVYVSTDGRRKPDTKPWIIVITFFFEALPMFLALALVFHITRSKGRGLWSVTGAPNPAAAHYSMQPGQYGQQPALGQGYVYAQPPQANMGQQGWQPQMYYYPQQQYPQPAPQPMPQQPMYQQQVPQPMAGQQPPAQAILQQYSQHPVVPAPAPHPGTVPSPLSHDQTGSTQPTQTTGAPINPTASELDQGIKSQ